MMKNGEQKKFNLKSIDKNIMVLSMIFFGIIVAMSILEPAKFLSTYNFKSMSVQFPEYGILAIGMMLCMLSGGIDLSTVGIANLSAVVAAVVMVKFMPQDSSGLSLFGWVVLAIVMATIAGALCGILNGFLIGYVGIPAMLVTLAGLQVYSGLALAITKGPAITGIPQAFQNIGNGDIFGIIPIPLLIFILLAICIWLMMKSTVYGQHLYMMGSNNKASKYSGINNLKVTIQTYMLSGVLAAIAGVIICSRYGSAKSDYGTTYTLQTLLIVILGGVNPNGGKGKVGGVVLSIMILQMISSAFSILRFSSFIRDFVWGVVLIIVMVANYWMMYHPSKKKI